jgi:hypothetical protein
MSYKFSSPQSKQVKSSTSLMHYVAHLQQHMTAPGLKQELNYQSQAQLELLASRRAF